MSLSASNPSDRVDQLLALTERLNALLSAEAEAYEAHRPQDVAAQSAETLRLANVYRHESVRLRAEPALIAGAPKDKTLRLIEATRSFEALLERHGRAVAAAKTVTEGLVKAIADEIVTQRGARAGYGPGARGRKGEASAITLNKRA